jgi:hypothetical protein
MKLRKYMLKSQRKKNQYLRLFYIATCTTQRNNNHQGMGMGVEKNTMDQHGTREATNMEALGGIKVMHGDVKSTQQRHGSESETKIKIEERLKLDPMSIFH